MSGGVWFTSDLHFGHRMVAELRGFETTDEHDEYLCERWVERVSKRDQVWILGDIAVSAPARALALIAALPGTKHLVAGNHDGCHPMHRDSHRRAKPYFEVFDSVQAFARRRIDGVEVMLSHFPYTSDRGIEARYPQYRLPDLGVCLLHGHTHLTERHTSDHEMHVGVDAWDFAPVGIDKVTAWIKLRHVDRLVADRLACSQHLQSTSPPSESLEGQ